MGTRSTIAVKHEDETVSQVYCHWDGYLEHNGKLLVENYNTLEAAERLVCGGDMSSLGRRIEPIGVHTFGDREKDTTVYYGRDRGEDWAQTKPREFDSFEEFQRGFQSEEYDYLFMAGTWVVRVHGEFAGVVSELIAPQIAEE